MPVSDSPIYPTAEYSAQLDTLVSLLQLATALPEATDATLIGQMVESLQTGAANAGLPAVPELLRSWQSALQDLARRDAAPSPDDLIRMSLWFGGLQEHLAGRLNADGRRMLARMPEDIRWLPRLSPSFAHVIVRRLDHAAEAMAALQAGDTAIRSEPAFTPAQTVAEDALAEDAESLTPKIDIAPTTAAVDPTQNDAFAVASNDGPALAATPEPSLLAMDPPGDAGAAMDGDAMLDDAIIDGVVCDANETPFAFDRAQSVDDAVRFDLDAASDPRESAGSATIAAETPIWIGAEELELTRMAIVDQLLPLALSWSEATDADAANTLIDELSYQCQLVENVMELIGTPVLGEGMSAVREGLVRRDPAVTPDTIVVWLSALLDTFVNPGQEAAESLASAAQESTLLDATWADRLALEMARIVIGQDPNLIAQRKTLADVDDVELVPADDVLPSVLEGMLRELPDNTARLGAAMRAFVETRSAEPADEARRVAHTLKGDANTVGVRGLANLTHALEDILIALSKRPEQLDDTTAELLVDSGDRIEEIADHLFGRGPAPSDLLDIYQRVLDAANRLTSDGDVGPAAPRPQSATTATQPAKPGKETAKEEAAPEASGMAASGIQSLNVPSTLLDELQRLSGESMVTARQIDQQLESLGAIHREQRLGVRATHELMGRLDDLVALRGAALQSTAQQTGAELDPLEIDQYNELHVISRQLLEAHADSGEFVRRIDRIVKVLSDLRSEQEQLNRDLQRTILRTRTVPFGQISQRLQRIVRQTSKQVFKTVALEIVGEDIPVDAELLERIVEPLAHLLRNAIDHGIETPEDRAVAGKPECGRIVVRVGLQGDAALIEIQDDGRGLDLAAIRRRGIEAGLIRDDQWIDERQLERLILLPGFSTRDAATEVSGRGIGMDVVNQRVAALRGTLNLASTRGLGTRVQLRLPVTQTLANVLIARGQHQVNAVVSASVERVVSFAPGECRLQDGQLRVRVDDVDLLAWPMETFYNESYDPSLWLSGRGVGLYVRDAIGNANVVLVRAIDEVRSVVVKPLGSYLPPIPAVRGITQLGDGSLAPVIDLDVLIQAAAERGFASVALKPEAIATTRVVVADDSLSVRRALEQLMQDAGFEVATARDGFEALAEIQARPTHALLVDLEMPRMNGLEVARNLRNQSETRDLPVVMITSRATDKHQAMAEQAGVTRMLGKPYSEDALVQLVRELIAARATAAAAGSEAITA